MQFRIYSYFCSNIDLSGTFMNLNRLVITLLMLASAVSLSADKTEDLRNALSRAKGEDRIIILGEIYNESQETDDVAVVSTMSSRNVRNKVILKKRPMPAC